MCAAILLYCSAVHILTSPPAASDGRSILSFSRRLLTAVWRTLSPVKQPGQQKPTGLQSKNQQTPWYSAPPSSGVGVENEVTPALSVNNVCTLPQQALDPAVIFYLCNVVDLLCCAVQVLPPTSNSRLQTDGQAVVVPAWKNRASIPRLSGERRVCEVAPGTFGGDKASKELGSRRVLECLAPCPSEVVGNLIKLYVEIGVKVHSDTIDRASSPEPSTMHARSGISESAIDEAIAETREIFCQWHRRWNSGGYVVRAEVAAAALQGVRSGAK
ncbi:hypothetical protein CSUI_008253 [Cystoisospora suis]|uniref:Uncharacterized protein n=1 Tax=Cystoisospora suis TaxID=483139 RepID=A0A2C6KMS3_9APIC|nr:hypothetical protein CSUI_008253 [Cystoisospora suis]